jgi:hypothetical protein
MQPAAATAGDRNTSIDFVPVTERHGKVWHQGPFWFTGNLCSTMVMGFPAQGSFVPRICVPGHQSSVRLAPSSWRSTTGPTWGYPR